MKLFNTPLARKLKDGVLMRVHKSLYRPGHYYSPIPDVGTLPEALFDQRERPLPGIDLNVAAQLELLHSLADYYPALPFRDSAQPNLRYYYQNGFFVAPDAIFLYCMLRHFQPSRVVEIGSGFSSALMLDTNALFLNQRIQFTFVEPYPQRLYSLLNEVDRAAHTIRVSPVQAIEDEVITQLRANDVLFVDSSHVAKIGSDVNDIFFRLLPLLQPGVLVHFHDVCYPFEYPRDWIHRGTFWNEAYLLRSFLMYNAAFEILLFNNYLAHHHAPWLAERMPLCQTPGGSIWLRKK